MYNDNNGKERYLNNQKVLRDKKGEVQACHHVCLLHKGEFIDNEGKVNVSDYNWIQIIDEEEFIKRALNNIKDWNIDFNRKYINEIEEKLEINLQDIII